jgi:hypothetical protein
MPKTRINCPNCRQPIVADIEQLFDVAQDPSAKQRLLSGAYNQIQCPNCGYQGSVATPIVYHDPEKELLLTFVPPDFGMSRDDQERMIGAQINQVVNKLPQEKRKGYLLRPQPALTMQGLVERILEADGITREMIQAQQQRLNLLQRLATASEEARAEIIKQEDENIDGELFTLLNRLAETSMMSGDQESARQLAALQQSLVQNSTFGHELQSQAQEVEAAMASLREMGQELTREKLLDLLIKAPNETRLNALVSMARPGMDYQFFQMLSDRIDRARGDGRTRLVELRERLLELTRQVDQQMEARANQSRQLLNSLLQSENIAEDTLQVLPGIDEFFLQELNAVLEAARKKGDLEQVGKLQQIVDVIQQASQPPAEVALIEELLEAPDDQTRRKIMENNQEKITPEFLDALTNLVAQVESSEDKALADRLKAVNREALRFSMARNLKG